MNSKTTLFIAGVVLLGCFAMQTEGFFTQNSVIPGIPCTVRELGAVASNCMVPFARQNMATFLSMMNAPECTREMVDCEAVAQTQSCMANLDITAACKANIRRISDFQFEIFNIACRVSHFEEYCHDEFVRRGLVET